MSSESNTKQNQCKSIAIEAGTCYGLVRKSNATAMPGKRNAKHKQCKAKAIEAGTCYVLACKSNAKTTRGNPSGEGKRTAGGRCQRTRIPGFRAKETEIRARWETNKELYCKKNKGPEVTLKRCLSGKLLTLAINHHNVESP